MTNVYIKTFGCSANFAESGIMAGLLEDSGSHIVDGPESADVVIVNTCTVKGEFSAMRGIRKLKKDFPKKKIVVGGCITEKLVSQIEGIAPETSILNTHNIDKVVGVVKSTEKGKKVTELEKRGLVKACLPKVHYNSIINIVPIASGCTSFCTYCSTKLVKGNIQSYPSFMIVKEIKDSIRNGCREIWLTSQDNGDYGLEKEKKSQLPKLLKEISKIEGNFFVRVGMTNPNGVLPVLDEFVEAFSSEKILKFVHLPVQSGSNDVLKRMARKYKVEDFKKIVKKLREKFPKITLSTDVILGFPAETEKQFMDTVKLIKEIKPDVLNISRFIKREGTAAEKFRQLHDAEKKERSRLMTKVFNEVALEKNREWIGWQGEIIIDEIGKNKTFVGRNFAYKPVIVKEKVKLGNKIKVKITDATKYDLRAEVLD